MKVARSPYEINPARGMNIAELQMIFDALNNPRLPPGGWPVDEQRPDCNSVLPLPRGGLLLAARIETQQ